MPANLRATIATTGQAVVPRWNQSIVSDEGNYVQHVDDIVWRYIGT
jgi:hypothetical protein